MQTNMEKDTVTGEYDLLEKKLQVKQERVYGWTCACASTAGKDSLRERRKGENEE